MVIDIILVFLLGVTFGSFVNAWVWRVKTGRSVASGRSVCPNCKKQIEWYDNIPLVSYVVLRGKCRKCKKPISIQYPIVEMTGGLSFAGLYLHFLPTQNNTWLELALWCAASVFLLAAFVYDLKNMLLPDRFTLPVIGIGVMLVTLNSIENGSASIQPQLIATTIFVIAYFSLWFFSKGRYLGDGDIRMAAVMGLLLTVPQLIVGVFVAYMVGALTGLYLILRKSKKSDSHIPMGPFLIFGIYFGLLFGEQIVGWYMKLMRF